MKKTSPISLAAAVFLAAVAFTNFASAQTTATWTGGNTTNNYNVTGSWSTGVIPNAIDSRAVFTSASSASWTNATNTLGSILVSGGTVVLGQPAANTNVLILDVSTGKPIISNATTLFMYADVQGNEGFTKLGGGDLSFRFNARDLTYTGDIELLGGSLSVNQASSLGNVNNKLLVGANSTFAVANGANTGNFNFESTRTFVVSNGVTFNIRTINNNVSAVFSNSIVESGTPGARIDFQNVGAVGTNESTANRYTLAGTTNNWSGRTTIQLGAKLTLASGTVISTNELNFSSGSGTWAGIDLGGNTQSVGHLGIGGSSTTARTFVISNGILRVTNPTAAFTFSGANGTLVDASNSTGFVFDGAGAGRNFIVRPDVTAGVNTTNTMILATAGAGSNTITALDILVGTASGTIGGVDHMAVLVLGKTNNLYANQLLIGGFNGAGTVQYAGGLGTPSTVLRGTNGVAAMGNLIIGETSSGVRTGAGVLDLSAGNVDALIATNFVIGRHIAGANNNNTSSFSMGGGTLIAPSLLMAVKTSTGTPTLTSTFNQGGGTVTISNITMGSDAGAGATATLLPTYNLNGGTLLSTNITVGGGAFNAASSRTLNFSNGAALRNISGANLSVTGFNSTAGGRLNLNLAGNGTVEADSGQTVTFGANTRLSGAGDLTKTGAGTLILSSGIAGANTGALNISNGVVQLNATGVAAAGTVTSVAVGSAATLLISQSDQVNNSATVTLSGGTIQRASGVSEKFGALDITADSTLDYVGGTAGTLEFGVYEGAGTPSHVLTINNFGLGNVLKFGSDLTGFIPIGFTQGSTFSNSYFTINGMSSDPIYGGFTAAFSSGTFTITSVPEPSTYVAAVGLLGLMLWPARRRLLALAVRK
jgi:autotransporter-associated beta strand protein